MIDELGNFIPDAIVELEKEYYLCADGEEQGFSWRPCEWCKGLAGNRFKGITHRRDTTPIEVDEWSVCQDCICYAANGDINWSEEK